MNVAEENNLVVFAALGFAVGLVAGLVIGPVVVWLAMMLLV